MIIDITCPNCNFSKKVPGEKIPEGIKFVKCPRCNNTFELPQVNGQAGSPGEDEDPDSGNVTNTDSGPALLDEVGYFTGLWRTFKGVLFSPALFFSSIRHKDGVLDSLTFGILLGAIGVMFNIFWAFLFRAHEMGPVLEALTESVNMNYLFILCIVISPFLVLLCMLVTAVILHFFLFCLRGAHRGFTGTLKVSAYSDATLMFCLIPIVGKFIGLIWWLVILVTGLREIHETSTPRALLSLLIPLFIFAVPVIFAVIFVISSLVV